MGIIEQLQQENKELRQELREFKEFVSDYISQVDDEIKGYEAASKFLGCSVSSLHVWVRERKIPFNKNGKTVTFSRQDLVNHKRKRRIGKRDTYTLTKAA
ncbi:helix-turn-helix domain-containing protein [Pontibacter qinzhouensis]|uniref:Helix-turn-helix domain-containing protein n=1 Tax=Pontibacter qinzhouensis TaxID=2603253 RepID=A0A5C8KD52_9BACT|nr:helix-turn-helix domain-containing protein [Pontibacter qinzhouensis]TXK52340.1 helix-turn-helix domain-containing protein [Pontibacter qinzhouensis]